MSLRVEELERLNSEKDETIRRHVDTLERNDVIVARMTRSVTSLEASLATSRDQLADSERALAARIKETESKTEECRRTQQLLDESTENVHQLQTSLARAEESVSEKQRDLDQCSRRVAELEGDNTHLRTKLMTVSTRLEDTQLQLDGTRLEKNRLQNELETTSRVTEELRMELKSNREQTKTFEDERQRLERDVNQINREYSSVLKQLISVTRHSTAVPATTQIQTSVSARKLFDVQVKHEKSSTSNVSPSVTHRDVTDSQRNSTAPSRRVIITTTSGGRKGGKDEGTFAPGGVFQERHLRLKNKRKTENIGPMACHFHVT